MKQEKKTQRSEVLKYLIEHETMTSKQAYDLFGAERLAAIVHYFRKHGHLIDSIDCTGKNRYDETGEEDHINHELAVGVRS